uniref:Uncharacterized protein n=1 Tax=Chromera velia CCMP2878 TaxID=1169474 RepID=A0A0G4H875_9ALVE|eukprot:Cvel_5869.t1-p1 / transcript=Cvel_5869.t1 / gene=Cvel_5869 / organism=Chromera_velia_CCMP2878 / gene_product=hypothetical protein / transcript_product=hypothetical protein / location=Cvel_scaffold279:53471-57671(-) / protein_length=539 / sequence_SO=supercontig / SO=protein_coding / is_pseudo=false
MSPRLPFLPPEPSDRKQWFRPMPVHPSLFQNEKVKAAFAGGEGLLVLTENRKKTYLCRPDDPQCLSFGLPEDMHIPSENASAAFGSDFFLIVLQNQTDSLRQLFAGSVPPPGNPEAGLSFHAIAVGEGRTNVTEVTAGMKFGLARLHNGDVVRAGVDITGKWSGVENSPTLFPQTLEAIGYDALKGKVRLLPKSFYLSGGSIFLTDDGLKGAGFWPGPWWNALLSDQDPMWRGLGVFKKKYPPRLAKGGCKVPIEWQGNYTNPSEATSLPVRILQYQSTASSDNRRWLDFPPEGAGVPLHRKVRLGCRGLISEHESLCIQTERRNSSTFQDRAEYVPEFVDLPSEISCAGCVVPSLWTNKEPPSPSLPFSLELKRGDDPNGTFTEYDKDTPAGAGDLLRLGCRGVLGASSDGDLRRAAEGIECRLKEEDGVRGIDWEIPSENSTAFTCTGCVVPAAWIPNPNSERLRYYVDVKGVVEAGSKKRKALDKTKGIGPVGVNDTIVFSCPNGGVPTRKRARCVVGGDGSPLFDAEVADVQCGE